MNKKILVTGSTKGIGKGIISKFHSEGWQVCVNGRSEANVEKIVSDFNDQRDKSAIGIASDLGSFDERLKVFKKISNEIGLIDGIILNIGSGTGATGVRSTFEENLKLVEINYLNTIKSFDMFLKLLKPNEGKSIVFIGSIASSLNVGAPISYAYSKKALAVFAKCQSLNLIPQKINIFALNPGHILTENGVWGKFKNESNQEFEEFVRRNIPVGKMGDIKDVSDFVYHLVENQNNYYFPGNPINLDGGSSLLY
jgi:3-oxoacyl-[acyl-carrier protein] reductase